jgi:FkbM family methyltransferase
MVLDGYALSSGCQRSGELRGAPTNHLPGRHEIVNLLTKIVRVLWIRQYRAALLRTRVVAATEHDKILAGLELDTVVDIGANRGQFALCVRRLYPQSRIISFEPLHRPAATFRRTFSRDPRVTLFNKAVAAECGSAHMHVVQWDASSSLLPIAQAQRDNYPFMKESRLEAVETATLSDCIDAGSVNGRALLKLDVQGFELTALSGCEPLLDRFKFVYVEASFVELYVGQALASDVVGFLLSKGFRLTCVANLSSGRMQRPIQADFLFSRT